MLRFSLKTLLADRGKLLTALVGVIFSLVLVNIQGGLFLGLIRKASVLIDNSKVDIWVGHRGLENVEFAYEIPEVWIDRIRGLPEVALAEPYIVGKGMMTLANGGYEDVWVIGVAPRSLLGAAWDFAEGELNDVYQPHAIMVDQLELRKLGYPKVGDVLEINNARAKVAAITKGFTGFVTNPYILTPIDSARTYTNTRDNFCSFFLVQAVPGTDLSALCAQIRTLVPDADVYLASELARRSQRYWMLRTGIGISFGVSTLLGLLVGLVMVGQSMYAQVLDHISDYATLKAIGARDGHVYRVLATQAMTIALIGTVLGLGVALVIEMLGSTPMAPIRVPLWLRLAGIGLVFSICLLSCYFPFRRIRSVDPISVLQG